MRGDAQPQDIYRVVVKGEAIFFSSKMHTSRKYKYILPFFHFLSIHGHLPTHDPQTMAHNAAWLSREAEATADAQVLLGAVVLDLCDDDPSLVSSAAWVPLKIVIGLPS